MPLEVVVLAAGNSKRMRSRTPKVFHTLLGRPMLAHVLEAIDCNDVDATHVVIQPTMERLAKDMFGDAVHWVHQDEQLGTAHAVRQALPSIQPDSNVLVVNGDTPLLTSATVSKSLENLDDSISLVTAELTNPAGYGRIVRNGDGSICEIVEDKDATPEQREIREINSGIIGAPASLLSNLLDRVECANAQSEYYLTDIIKLAIDDKISVHTVPAQFAEEVVGVNDRIQLAEAERIASKLKAHELMESGVTLLDPDRVDIRGSIEAGIDCTIDINVVIEGSVKLGEGVSIGVGCILKNVELGDGVQLSEYCILDSAVIGKRCLIGPYARIRPGSVLEEDVRIGNFVEVKNSRLGSRTKANHLAYVGDAEIGANTNVGAGAITCNFDGKDKHKTIIGDNVFVGTNCTLVAPLKVGSGAFLAAGSTITQDVPGDVLAIARERQRTVSRWKPPGSRSKS